MQKIVRTAAPPGIDFTKDWADFSSKEKTEIKLALTEMTGGYCSYTNKKLGELGYGQIDFFIPKAKGEGCEWGNLFIANTFTHMVKRDSYNELLLRPDAIDYKFDRYFDLDFDKHLIIPNSNASKEYQQRALITIDILGLNHPEIIKGRASELQKFLNIVDALLHRRDVLTNSYNTIEEFLANHPELDIDEYSYRFYLGRALKKFRVEKNEYVNEVNISKYFCVENFHINNLQNKKEVYFLGENGDGKTIVLQAIVLALKGLSDKFIYKYINTSVNNFDIEINDKEREKYKYNNYVSNVHPDVYAYGVGRLRNHKDHDDEGYLTLFDYDAYLTNPVEWFKEVDRLENKGISKLKLSTVKKIFEELLENKVNIEETPEGDYIFKEKNTILEFRQLSDGYRSVLIWLSDLLSRLAKNQPEVERLADYKAVVLVDEIGSFLHPRWEYTIVGKLRKLFPKIQWFFTTHSPIITLGASEDAVFYKIYKEDGITKVSEPFHAEFYANRLLSNFVTSPLFNLETARPAAFDEHKHEDLETGNYLYSQIHKQVKERIKNKPLQEEEIRNVIDEILNKLEKAGQI